MPAPTEAIVAFIGENRFLSNFWLCEIEYEGAIYRSVEHAYQAAKTLDPYEKAAIRVCLTPGQAKRVGKKVRIRSDWEYIKVSVMESLLRKKFYHENLKSALLNTGNAIIMEGNTWGDTFWGICDGKGQNHLGKLLMKIRQELSIKQGTC